MGATFRVVRRTLRHGGNCTAAMRRLPSAHDHPFRRAAGPLRQFRLLLAVEMARRAARLVDVVGDGEAAAPAPGITLAAHHGFAVLLHVFPAGANIDRHAVAVDADLDVFLPHAGARP